MNSSPAKSHQHQHRRQTSNTTSIILNQNYMQNSFQSLENFMNVTKCMQDEIMVPSKLKDKPLGNF
jgi:hypothetical protein